MRPADYDQFWKDALTVAFVPLTRGKFAIVDRDDLPAVSRFKWTWMKGYAIRRRRRKEPGNKTFIYMHRAILGTSADLETDHVNRIRWDNRKNNLRSATRDQNASNQAVHRGRKYKGVYPRSKGRPGFMVTMRRDGALKYVGTCSSESDAAEMYDRECIRYRGEFAVLNFPDRKPEYEREIAEAVTSP